MRLPGILHVLFLVAGICLVITTAQDDKPSTDKVNDKSELPGNNTNTESGNGDPSSTKGSEEEDDGSKNVDSSKTEDAADSELNTSDKQNDMSAADDKDTDNTAKDDDSNEVEPKDEDVDEEDVTKKKDDLNDNPQVLDPDSITDDSDARFHTVKLMLYIIAPVSALVVVYFIMKALKGNNSTFFNRYHIVGARGDNIELRPLGYDSDDEEDIVFDSARRP